MSLSENELPHSVSRLIIILSMKIAINLAYHHFFRTETRNEPWCRGHGGDGEIGGRPTALLGGSAAVGESAAAAPAGGRRRRHAERGERRGRGKTETGLGP